jgi:hypothetical protein
VVGNKHLERFQTLLEYTIKNGAPEGTGYVKNGAAQPNLTEEDPIPGLDPQPQPEAGANPQMVDSNPLGDAAPEAEVDAELPPLGGTPAPVDSVEEPQEEEKEEDIIEDILKMHASRLDDIEKFIESVDAQLDRINNQLTSVEDIKAATASLQVKVKKLTPPTPLESGNMMIAMSNGIRIEDQWNQWLAKNGYDQRLEQNPYYPKEENKEVEVPVDKIPRIPDSDVKNSFYPR